MAPGKANLSVASSAHMEAPSRHAASADRLASLFAPLDQLLLAGGDERLALVGQSGLNIYGCKPAPRPEAICFSSSTASSISGRAYLHARNAQERLVEQAAVSGLLESFDSRIEQARHTLRLYLGLEGTGSEVVFAPSGTDAQLLAVLLVQLFLGSPLTSIVVGADQTGSGTEFTASARHFGARTARGKSVLKGAPVTQGACEIEKIDIAFADESGAMRSALEMDRSVWDAVADAIAKGRKVFLQAMNASKFGWRAPSDECMARISLTWPGQVQIVVDACQMRIGRVRLRELLARNHIVLFTGSKFFSGPAFSGGLLMPKLVSDRLAHAHGFAPGAFGYADRSDIPTAWQSLRNELALEPNLGQWLRWEAALEEMRTYYTLPLTYRRDVVAGIAHAIRRAIAGAHRLEPLTIPAGLHQKGLLDEEFASPTIFPFVIRADQDFLEADAMSEIYRALNRDISDELRFDASPEQLSLAGKPCHIGQPVKLNLDGNLTAALRIAIGSRNLFETWSPGPNAAERAVERLMADVSIVLGKIELILKNREHAKTVVHYTPQRTMETSHGR